MLLDTLVPFRWQDFLDILITSVIVHRLFLLLRGTAAFQLLLGLFALWLVQAAAKSAGLVITSWFFQGVGAVAVLVIVVAFRAEIREVFIQSNPIRLLLGRPPANRARQLDEVVQAMFALAATRTGALVVIQNRDPLEGQLREGFPLEGRFNAQVLQSVFVPGAPFHDGAVVIRGNRLSRIGTFLPLTDREGLPQQYGSRHRAALGLSEVSDAVILVASEERGEVSLVHRGEIHKMQSPSELQGALEGLLGEEPATAGRTPGRVWVTKLGGLALTFLLVSSLWGMYAGRQLSLITVSALIDFRNIPETVELKRTSSERVEVQIRGKQRLVASLRPEQVRAFVDLKGMEAGTRQLTLGRHNIEVPPGLQVVRITPATITVEMEARVEREMVVKPRIEGLPPPGFQLAAIEVKPSKLKVVGPQSVLKSLRTLATAPINLEKIKPRPGEQALPVPVQVAPASVQLAPGQPAYVQVIIRLQGQEPPAPTPGGGAPPFHQVQPGDTLWGISRRYGIAIEELRRYNGLAPGAVIYPGQKLLLGPAGGPKEDSS